MTMVDAYAGLLLLLIFVLGTMTRANIGALGLLGAFVLGGLHLGEGTEDLLSGFPVTLFLLILGVTYLFSVASSNGTMDWIVGTMARLVDGRGLAVPVGVYLAAVLLTAFGAPSPAAVALLAPVAIRLGRTCAVPSLVTGLMILLGVSSGSFSPVNFLAIIASQSMVNGGGEPDPVGLFAGMLAANTVAAVGVLVVHVVVRRRRQRAAEREPVTVGGPGSPAAGGTDGPATATATGGDGAAVDHRPGGSFVDAPVVCTLVGFAVVMVGALAFGVELGALALAVALVLHMLFPRPTATDGITWQIILLICGLMTFIGVMQRAGTFDRLGDALGGFGSPVLAAL